MNESLIVPTNFFEGFIEGLHAVNRHDQAAQLLTAVIKMESAPDGIGSTVHGTVFLTGATSEFDAIQMTLEVLFQLSQTATYHGITAYGLADGFWNLRHKADSHRLVLGG